MDNAIFETLMYVDPVSRGTARPIAFDTSERARLNIATVDDADAAVRLAYALAANGWHPHQHRTAVAKAEQESVGFIGPLTEECARALQRCQTLADDIAFRPPPTNPVPDHDVPWPRDSAGRYRLKWINDDRPSERTTTHTDDLDDEKRSIIWRTIVAEIASYVGDRQQRRQVGRQSLPRTTGSFHFLAASPKRPPPTRPYRRRPHR